MCMVWLSVSYIHVSYNSDEKVLDNGIKLLNANKVFQCVKEIKKPSEAMDQSCLKE